MERVSRRGAVCLRVFQMYALGDSVCVCGGVSAPFRENLIICGNLYYLKQSALFWGHKTYLVILGVVFITPFNISDLKVCGL